MARDGCRPPVLGAESLENKQSSIELSCLAALSDRTIHAKRSFLCSSAWFARFSQTPVFESVL